MTQLLKHSLIAFLILSTQYSCVGEEEDGDGTPVTTNFSFLENNTEHSIQLTFKLGDLEEEVQIESKETITLAIANFPSTGVVGGVLRKEPFVYEKLTVESDGFEDQTFLLSNCLEANNPICFDNYEVLKEETDANGNKGIELKFTYN